ncbi:putative nuclease HARBI1 [Ostrea edulis]|uniref:putative nuclease HARBI1 n=1 Tax=Ostrea edulis TaxID=37623 RepID=UPI0024AF899A|nr:putative nuclease HARBI1 [Ostrea edulis]
MAAHRRIYRRLLLQNEQQRRPRLFRDRSNPLEVFEEDEIFDRYRFRPQTIYYILSLLPNLRHPTKRNNPLPPLLQLLVCLRYLSTGTIHLLIGDSLNISRSTAGTCIRDISAHVSNLRRRSIRFPKVNDAARTKRAFSTIAGFPNILGCIDGTQIRMKHPKQNEVDYMNRKGYHSLNVQMCCDETFKLTSCVASWPGSVHDSRHTHQFFSYLLDIYSNPHFE